MLKNMKKKYVATRPRKAYTLGIDVCFSKLLRTGYLDSCFTSQQEQEPIVAGKQQLSEQDPRCTRSMRRGLGDGWDVGYIPPYQCGRCGPELCLGMTTFWVCALIDVNTIVC